MNELIGDFWQHAPNYQAILVTTNGIVRTNGGEATLVMGAGIAKQVSDRYPVLQRVLGHWVLRNGNLPKVTRFINQPSVISMPTKAHWKDPSPLDLIAQSARIVVNLIQEQGYDKVLSTRPGCGLGGCTWDEVKPILQAAGWDDRFTIISFGR